MSSIIQQDGEIFYRITVNGTTYFNPQCQWILCYNSADPTTKFCCIEHAYNHKLFSVTDNATTPANPIPVAPPLPR